jgi:hypothetical protein
VNSAALPLGAWFACALLGMATPGWIVAHGGTGSPGPGDLEESQQKAHFPEWLGTAQWLADGSIQTQVSRLAPLIGGPVSGEPEAMDVRYRFGLPQRPPDPRWREEDKLPIYHLRLWKGGMHLSGCRILNSTRSFDASSVSGNPGWSPLRATFVGRSSPNRRSRSQRPIHDKQNRKGGTLQAWNAAHDRFA